MTTSLTTVAIDREPDVVIARRRARQIAGLLGFDRQDQARLATAVSELARNAFQYATGGTVQYLVSADEGEFVVTISDRGPGIPSLDEVLDGRYKSQTGMGLGIAGARRLMDRFEIESAAGAGTTVTIAKRLSQPAPTTSALARIAGRLAQQEAGAPTSELQVQNQELMRALEELHARRDELARLNRELEETNRGVVALYAELDERAEELRRSSEAKTAFLSSVSHELRTPLSSMLALCDLLLGRADGPLTDEQERQIAYIRDGAQTLLPLVNDLLDLARIEAGKTVVHAGTFAIEDLFASLRGMFRPLHRDDRVALVFEPADDPANVRTDESKVAQVLRNLVSNALKFTEDGEVRVCARLDREQGTVKFIVADTGIGIAPEDRARIFEEFEQVQGPLQAATRGTGLGLAVSQRLAAVLGGAITLDSRPGEGSTFTLSIPLADTDLESIAPAGDSIDGVAVSGARAVGGKTAIVIDDDQMARYLAVHALNTLGIRVTEAKDATTGLRCIEERAPDLIVLDLRMPGIDGFDVLDELQRRPATAAIPVVVQTGMTLTASQRKRLLPAIAVLDKREHGSDELIAVVSQLLARQASEVHRTVR
jgi:signal transduction histidine kinase/ActR/RegA family two-component response regulator